MVMTRPQMKASIKEQTKHVPEDSRGLELEEILCQIFSREGKNGTHDVLSTPNDELCKLSYRDESGDAAHLSPTDSGRIILLLHYQKCLVDQGLHPDDGSFRHVSITLHDFNAFRTHTGDLAMSNQDVDIKVETHRSF